MAEPVQRSSLIGPAAQLLLQGLGLSATDVTPTGPGGIVTKGDVLAAAASGVKPGQAPQPQPKRADGGAVAAQQGDASAQLPSVTPQPAVAPQPSPAVPQQQPLERSQRSAAGRSPDSKLRAIVAEKMLQEGQRIPDAWLRDWVGAPKK